MSLVLRELPPPTWWKRLTAYLRRAEPGAESLVSAIEDHIDRLEGYAHRADHDGRAWVASTHRRNADDLRRILYRHRP